jgi:hypothetical protein
VGLQLRGNERERQTLRHPDGGLAGADPDRVADAEANAQAGSQADAEADTEANAQADTEANPQAHAQANLASHSAADRECDPKRDLRLAGPPDRDLARDV